MKKNLFYLVALICSMSLLVACSDSEEEASWKKLPAQEISAENLSLTTNAQLSPNASVTLSMIDAQNGVLVLNNAVRGMDAIEVNVTVSEQPDASFKFQGEKSVTTTTKALSDLVSATTVKVSGSMTLEGTAEVAVITEAAGNLVKNWLLCDAFVEAEENPYAYAPFHLNWNASDAGDESVSTASGNLHLVGTAALSAIMTKLLKNVEFRADGSIVADYAENVELNQTEIISAAMGTGLPSTENVNWLTSPANLAYWYAGNDHIYVVLDIPAIVAEAMKDKEDADLSPEAILGMVETIKGMSGAQIKQLLGGLLQNMGEESVMSKMDLSKISDADIEKLIGYVVNGFPLSYKISEVTLSDDSKVNSIYIYLDKEIFDMFMPAIYPMLPAVDTLLKETVIELYGTEVPLWTMVQMLTQLNSLTDLEKVWNATESFNIGLDLGAKTFKVTE